MSDKVLPAIEPHLAAVRDRQTLSQQVADAQNQAQNQAADEGATTGETSSTVEQATEGATTSNNDAADPQRTAPRSDNLDPQFSFQLEELRRMRDEARQEREEAKRLRDEQVAQERKWREDPIGMAKRYGGSLEEWTNAEVGETNEALTAARQADARIAELEKRFQQSEAEKESLRAEQKKANEAAQLQQFKDSLRQQIDGTPELKILSLAGDYDRVYSAIEQDAIRKQQLYGRADSLLDPVVAGKEVLKDRIPELRKLVEGLRELEEFKDLFGQPTRSATSPTSSAPSLMSSTVTSEGVARDDRPLTDEERKARLVAMLKEKGWR